MTDLLIVYREDTDDEWWVADLYRDGEFVREVEADT